MADEDVVRPLEQLVRSALLHHLAVVHDDDRVGERERLGLVVGDVDEGVVELGLYTLEHLAQAPLLLRIDHRQRLVEEDRRDVLADEGTRQRDELLGISGETLGPSLEQVADLQQFGDLLGAPLGDGLVDAPVAQRELHVLLDGHRVVEHRELEDLGDVALGGRQLGDIDTVEQQPTGRGLDEAGDDVEHRGLATAARSEQGVGPAVLPREVDALERIVAVAFG